MQLPITAGPRRRIRRALVAAVLPAILVAFALPSAAHATTVGTSPTTAGSDLFVHDPNGTENNDLSLRMVGDKIVISERGARIASSTSACQVSNLVEAICLADVNRVFVVTGAGSDKVEYGLPHEGQVGLMDGVDTLVAGTREAAGRAIEPVVYSGGPGRDEINYVKANRGVSLTPGDNLANDGRPDDKENVSPDFETSKGSNFRDAPLFGTPNDDVMIGNGGNDQIGGGGGNDVFVSSGLDGADDYHGGPGSDWISYSGRNQPLLVTLDNVANDGESGIGEDDNVRSNVENIVGGSGGDVLDSLGAFSTLIGGDGGDFLFGGPGPDTLFGEGGVDNINAGDGNDVVDSRDLLLDTIDCSAGSDTLLKDSVERRVKDCEDLPVGTLRLDPKSVRALAGKPVHVRLSWRHPRAWRKLRTIELRLTRDGMPVGEITIRPHSERITDDGAVTLVRRATRLTRQGKTVAARLALRLDQSLAGQTLRAEVEATDRPGRRQFERDAGRIRVSG